MKSADASCCKYSPGTRGFVILRRLQFRNSTSELTGSYKSTSALNSIDIDTGKVKVMRLTPEGSYGEGLVHIGDKLIQLTYKEKKIFIYDYKSFALLKTLPYSTSKEGWGISESSEGLVVSDGSSNLFIIDKSSFQTKRIISVRSGQTTIDQLNQLQVVDDVVYANVFTTNYILKIRLSDGCILSYADMSPLLEQFSNEDREYISSDNNFVLNGIAYNPSTKNFFVTGKNWSKIFEVRFQGD
ncbi:MAG: glutaminyl-peptide cyclotransferase [Bdellovibrio sp.]